MRTNLKDVTSYITNELADLIDTGFDLETNINDGKVQHGVASINFQLHHLRKTISVTLYIIESETRTTAILINDRFREIVFNNFSNEAIGKTTDYTIKYLRRISKKIA